MADERITRQLILPSFSLCSSVVVAYKSVVILVGEDKIKPEVSEGPNPYPNF